LLGLKAKIDLETAADQIIQKGLTVRAAEKLVEQILNPPKPKPAPVGVGAELQQNLRAVEQKLTRHFSTAVAVHHGEKKGRLELEYYGVENLNRLLDLMGLSGEAPAAGDFIQWPDSEK